MRIGRQETTEVMTNPVSESGGSSPRTPGWSPRSRASASVPGIRP